MARREAVKLLKASLASAQDDEQVRQATVALLRHSLRLGHPRLSLQRLEAAVSCGADLAEDDLHRCAELVLRIDDVVAHGRLARLSRKLTAASEAGRAPSC